MSLVCTILSRPRSSSFCFSTSLKHLFFNFLLFLQTIVTARIKYTVDGQRVCQSQYITDHSIVATCWLGYDVVLLPCLFSLSHCSVPVSRCYYSQHLLHLCLLFSSAMSDDRLVPFGLPTSYGGSGVLLLLDSERELIGTLQPLLRAMKYLPACSCHKKTSLTLSSLKVWLHIILLFFILIFF